MHDDPHLCYFCRELLPDPQIFDIDSQNTFHYYDERQEWDTKICKKCYNGTDRGKVEIAIEALEWLKSMMFDLDIMSRKLHEKIDNTLEKLGR